MLDRGEGITKFICRFFKSSTPARQASPHLPPEVLLNVFGYLSNQDLANVKLICRSWNALGYKEIETRERSLLDKIISVRMQLQARLLQSGKIIDVSAQYHCIVEVAKLIFDCEKSCNKKLIGDILEKYLKNALDYKNNSTHEKVVNYINSSLSVMLGSIKFKLTSMEVKKEFDNLFSVLAAILPSHNASPCHEQAKNENNFEPKYKVGLSA